MSKQAWPEGGSRPPHACRLNRCEVLVTVIVDVVHEVVEIIDAWLRAAVFLNALTCGKVLNGCVIYLIPRIGTTTWGAESAGVEGMIEAEPVAYLVYGVKP